MSYKKKRIIILLDAVLSNWKLQIQKDLRASVLAWKSLRRNYIAWISEKILIMWKRVLLKYFSWSFLFVFFPPSHLVLRWELQFILADIHLGFESGLDFLSAQKNTILWSPSLQLVRPQTQALQKTQSYLFPSLRSATQREEGGKAKTDGRHPGGYWLTSV